MGTDELVGEWGLEPHPEGGWFRRIYTSAATVPAAGGTRPAMTSILYLLAGAQRVGRLHRNASDIVHYRLDGGPLEYLVTDGRTLRRHLLTPRTPALVVPGGWWKASRLTPEAGHGLVGEAVTPGFDYADHEFATRATLATFRESVRAELAEFSGIDGIDGISGIDGIVRE